MRKLLLALAAILVIQISYGQDFSNKGKDFYIPYPEHIDASSSVMGIYITSDAAASGSIVVGTVTIPFTITANAVVYKFIGPNAGGSAPNTPVYLGGLYDNVVSNKAVHITATNPIVVFAHIIKSARSGATLALPTVVWGREYIIPSYANSGGNGAGQGYGVIDIIASKVNTVVEITPKAVTRNGLHPSGTTFTVTLPNIGDIYQLEFAQNADMSGTKIKSIASGTGGCNPVGVFSATTWSAINCGNGNGGDNFFQQLFPSASWGKQFFTGPLKKVATNPSDNNIDIIRVFVSDPTTVVYKTVAGITTQLTGLSANGFYEYTASVPTFISSDKPIEVVQYITTQNCGSPVTNSDPEMIALSSVEQTINDITVFSAHQNFVPPGQSQVTNHYINVIMKTSNTSLFKINGVSPIATFTAIPGTLYSYLKEDVSTRVATNPISRLTADSGFSAIAYGFGNVESYGYNAGSNVKDLYTSYGTYSQYGIEPGAVCTGSPFKIKISLPYKPDSIYWNLSAISPYNIEKLLPIAPADTLVIDSVRNVGGKDVYWYSLPGFYTFNTAGSYVIPITIFSANADGCGNVQDKEFNLDVSNPPTANFTFNAPGCIAEIVKFHDATVTTKPNYHWYWDFDDPGSGPNNISNLQDPMHLFSTPGLHNVRFSSITTPGCLSDTLTKVVTVPANPSAAIIVNNTTACQNSTSPGISIIGAGGLTPYIFSYNINGGPSIDQISDLSGTAVINVPTGAIGTFTYTLTNVKNSLGTICTTGLTGQAVTVTVIPLPTGTISGGTTVCQNATAPIITFTGASGTAPYNFEYTINNGSGPGTTQTVVSNAAGIATVTVPVATAGSATYTLTGVSYGSPAACVNLITGQAALVTVNPLPTATISGDAELCLNATAPNVVFTGAGGTAPYIFSYNINSGPTLTATSAGNTALVTVPTGTAGTYIYTLTGVKESSTTSCQQAATGTATVKVNPKPTASFTATGPYCKDKTVTFTPAGTVSSGTITSWVWDYGDGTGSHTLTTNAPFTITYTTTGAKTATLKTISDKGCESIVATQAFTVSAGPSAGFIVPEVCLLDPFAQFTDTSKAEAPNTITTWAWNFGDPSATPGNPNTSSVPNATHTYSAVGPYMVGLTVTTAAGCTDFIQHTLVINGGNPASSFTVNSASTCALDTTIITNKSTIGSGSITKLEIYWDLTNNPTVFITDDDPLFDKTYKHGYPVLTTDQNYTIRMRAYSGGICFSDKDMVITVRATPHVVFNAVPDVCLNNGTVQLTQGTETGGVAGTGIYSGTGVSSTGLFNPITAGVGTFTLKYKYTSAFGCVDSASQAVTVLAAPAAVFAAGTPSCAQSAVTFTQNSTSSVGPLAQWIWNFGGADEVHTDGNPVTHTFATAATYPVTLTVVTAGGCKSTVTSHNVVVNPNPLPSFAIGAPACLPAATITFTNTTPTASDNSYTWYFQYPSLTPSSSALNAQNTYTAPGPYTVRLAATNVLTGCTGTVDQTVNNIHLAPEASFTFSKASICTDQSVAVIGTSSTGGDGSITSYTWNYGDGSATAAGATPAAHTYTVPKTYDVTLTVENNFGCKDDSVRKFTVYPYPTVEAGDTHYVLEGGSTILQPLVTGTGLQYLWSASTSSTFLNSTTSPTPESRPLTDVTYTVLITADGGCTASDNVMVKILKFPEIPNTFTPNNDGIHDFWDIQYLYTYPNNRVQVFTKGGQLVFESKGYSKPWDGNMNGKPLPIDTYYYIIESGYGRKPITGYVTILK